MLKLNKHILSFFAVLCFLLIIPCSFAGDLANDTIISDINDEVVSASGDVIYVDEGTNSISEAVNEFNSSVNKNIYIKNGNYKIDSEIELNKDITIIGESCEKTILDGQGSSSIFKVTTNSKITLINLTFKNAKGSGALFLDSGDTIVVDNCIFDSNTAGAIYHKSYFGNIVLNVTDSIFKNNFRNDDGGAIFINRGSLYVTDSVFENNAVPIGDTYINNGGAIAAGGGTIKTISVDGCTFKNNTATRGSAISQYADGELYILNSIFVNNTSPGNYGNYKTNTTACVIDVRSSLNGVDLYLKNNKIENNVINDLLDADENVKINYLDKNDKITAENLEKIYGDDYNFAVTLTDINDNPLSGKEIVVTLTNSYDKTVTTISNITNSKGIAVINLGNQKPGKYNVESSFAGDGVYEDISTKNSIDIRTEDEFNIIIQPVFVSISEGDSFNITGYIYDEYLVPTNDASGKQFSIYWENYGGGTSVVEGGLYKVDGNKFTFDINRCHLITRDEPYTILFNITEIGSASVKVDLSKNTTNIDETLDVIYVSKDGSDEVGSGTKNNPLASLQMALVANTYLNGSKTIILGEGVYEISTFTIVDNVTIVGEKSKTILKQVAGKLGMFEIESGNTVNFVNLSFTGGYATPEPEGLIHVTDESTAYVKGCEFYENYAMDGAAIAISRHGTVYVDNSYFHDNCANTSSKVYGIGGAIYVHDASYLNVANSVFANNTARDGGAIFLGFGSEADIINSTFEDNKAIVTTLGEGGGGAIFTRSNNISIFNSTFKTNYAELYGGAIYLDYGDIKIDKAYFENNYVKRGSDEKGSTIESSYTSYSNITMHYSVIISDDENVAYAVFIHNTDENHTLDLSDNYWKIKSSKANGGSSQEVKIQVNVDNEYIYTGDVVEFTIELVSYNVQNGTRPLNGLVHDLGFKLIPTIGNIANPNIVIKDNNAKFVYNAITVGRETIYFENIFNHTTYKFNVLDGSDKLDLTHNIDINVNKVSTITVNFGSDVDGNVTIRVNDEDYSVEIKNQKAILEIETSPGDYSVDVIYPGDDLYKGFVEKDSFSVAKYTSIISAEDITVYFDGKFEAILKDGEGKVISGEKLNININGTDYTATTDEEGIATLNLNLASVGKYDVVTSFNGNKNYNSSSANSKITVIYTDIKLEVSDVVITPVNGTFIVKVSDNNGDALNGVNVVIIINGTEYNLKTVSDGLITVDLTDNGLDAGEYEVSVDVPASGVYGASSTTATITVEKIPLEIKAQDVSVFSNKAEFSAQLVDLNGNPVENKTLIFDVDGKPLEAITDSEGYAKLLLNLTSGEYTVAVNIKEDKIFYANEANATVKVISNTVNIKVSDITVYSSNGQFKATLTDVNDNPISSELIVTINGLSYILKTGADGSGSINISLPIGTHQVITQFRGTNTFQPSSVSSNITVLSSIISQDITRAFKSPYDFEAKLLDANGNPLVNETVNLVVNGNDFNVTTDSEGIARLSENLTVGKYAITVINPKTGEETANYAEIVKRITGNSAITMYFGASKYYKVRVYTDDGQIVGAGETVTFKINGKTYTRKTNSEGYASYKITQSAKTYTITATYKGVKVSNKVVVKPVLTAKNISKKKAKTIKFTAKLVNTKGKVLKGKTIKFTVKGKIYKAKTSKKGIATISLKNLKVGKYKVKVTYGKSTIKKTLTVKK
ncbi:Ig-like domain-containing protein [Methanobrevibacter sp.]|uniref:Ig-like domain-containing protein n=1 Tax=Methanobrevibacter sp. TaxID=66852 RepID=UPI00386E7A32